MAIYKVYVGQQFLFGVIINMIIVRKNITEDKPTEKLLEFA